jgi:predicted solute-binding protein
MTRSYGDEGRRAVEELLRRAQAAGVYENVRVEFVGAA